MNTIKTVGDLVKALSAYDENSAVEFSLNNLTIVSAMTTDAQIFRYKDSNIVHISLIGAPHG